jgi:hypothetical protein
MKHTALNAFMARATKHHLFRTQQVPYLGKNNHFKYLIIIHTLQVLENWVLGNISKTKRGKLTWGI